MPAPESPPLTDPRGRPLRDLRLSVTDRCNFRCRYCMPKEHFGPGFRFLPRADLLRFEEIARVARVFASLGVKKLRLTGGEPLLRSDLPDLVAQLATIEGVDLALTTNGSLLEARADELVRAIAARLGARVPAGASQERTEWSFGGRTRQKAEHFILVDRP